MNFKRIDMSKKVMTYEIQTKGLLRFFIFRMKMYI